MSRVRIITDSTVCFEDAHFVESYGITVLPLQLQFGDQILRDGIDIGAEEVLYRLHHTDTSLTVLPPPLSAFEEAYQKLSKTTDQICVLLHSQNLTETYAHAQTARAGLLGRCEIIVIDSQTTSLGLGYLVEAVAKEAKAGASLDEIVHIARGVVPRVYGVYYVDTLDYIQRAGLIGETQAVLGAMLTIKPLLTIEDGKMIVMEKVRTHSQAIDKMVEFVAEFTHIERMGIVQNTTRSTEHTRMLQDRLALAFSRLQYPIVPYEPLIANIIGPDGMGMIVLEGEPEEDDLLD
ncbi:MAG: DegV family protein [Anaerolineae bacterium]|nr:DegV family protein [Anaerolineae bacterium]